MTRSDFTVFTLGDELNESIHVLLRHGTITGDVEFPPPTLNEGLGHPALDGDFLVEEEGGYDFPPICRDRRTLRYYGQENKQFRSTRC